MTRSRKGIFIILEFVFGLAFGLLGGYIFSFFDKWDLYYSVMFTFLSVFASTLIGIGLVGFFYLKQINRTADFGESMLLSFFGLIGFLILYAIITSLTFRLIPHYLSSVLLPIILPMTGGVIGFNYKTRNLAGQIANE